MNKLPSQYWPPQGEAWIPWLIKKGRYFDIMVPTWQNWEDFVGQMVVQEFDLMTVPEGEDPRISKIHEVGFQRKLDFLKSMGRLSAPDVTKIRDFKKAKNRLLQGGVYTNPNPMTLPAAAKEPMMKLARTDWNQLQLPSNT